MKNRHFSNMAVSLLLMLSMLLSLSLSVTVSAAGASPQYSEKVYASPDWTHELHVEYRTDENGTDCHSFYICERDGGKIISRVIGQNIIGRIGVYWSPDGSYAAVDTVDDPDIGQSLTVLSAKNTRVWRVVDVGTDYNWIRTHDRGLALPPAGNITLPVWKFEKWHGNSVFSIITEYELDGRRIWSRLTLDAESPQTSQEWGESLNPDDPENPIWSRAKAIGTHNYNTPMHFQSPDYTYRIEVLNAHLRSNPQTWNFLYERILVHSGFDLYAYDLDTFHAALTEEMPYRDHPYWNSLCLKFSPDSRYMIAESMDAGAYPFYIDLETKAAAVLPPVWENREAFAAGEMTASVEAFSVFGDAAVILVGQDGSRQRVIFDMASGEIDASLTLSGDASDEALSCTAFPWPKNLRDAFSGFTAVSKTHTYGLDGLFCVDGAYWYLHMGQGNCGTDMTPAGDYVSRIQAIDHYFDRYRVLYSREGCWVLDENDRTVYAGTGNIRSCGAFALATNLRAKNPVDAVVTGKRLFDSSFHLLLDRVIDTAPQQDGSVYASHTVGRGALASVHLAYVSADGTVTDLGPYDGDLSEFLT